MIPRSGRFPGEGYGNLLQYSCLENPIDRGAPWGIQSRGSKRVGLHLETKTTTIMQLFRSTLSLGQAEENAEEKLNETFRSVHFSSVARSCPTLCDPMNRTTPGLPVHHHLPEFTHIQVHRVGDAIQPSHPLSSPSPPSPNPSQHQSLFQ